MLLARMRQMVEGVKRRQSMEASVEHSRRMSVSPRKKSTFSLLAAEAEQGIIAEEEEDRGMETDAVGGQPHDVDNEMGEEFDMFMGEEMAEEPVHADEAMDDEDENVPVAGPSTHFQPPKTPKMNDLRHVFSAPAAPATPRFTGVRELFREVPTARETPRMDGVRDMFLRERSKRGMEESALEGMGEMLASPAGWRGQPAPETAIDEREAEVAQQKHVSKPAPSRVTKSKIVRPIASIPRRTPRSAAQLPESREPEPAIAPEASADVATAASKGARVAPRTRTRTAESAQESAGASGSSRPRTEEEDTVPELASKTKPATRRKAASAASDDEAAAAPTTATRRTRKATASPAPEAEPSVTRVVRRTRRTPVPEEPPAAPVAKPSTGRRGTRAQPMEDVEVADQDPADQPAAAARVRRNTRSKIPVGAVKEEDDGHAVPPAGETGVSRTARGRKALGSTGAKAAARAGTSASKSTTRARTAASAKKAAGESSGKSTPSEEGELEEETNAGDKENTPEPQEEDEPAATKGKATAGATKVPANSHSKATRSATKGAVRTGTEEPSVAGEEPAAGRRVARTRIAVRR